MILNTVGQELLYDGQSYRIGDRIIGTEESEDRKHYRAAKKQSGRTERSKQFESKTIPKRA